MDIARSDGDEAIHRFCSEQMATGTISTTQQSRSERVEVGAHAPTPILNVLNCFITRWISIKGFVKGFLKLSFYTKKFIKNFQSILFSHLFSCILISLLFICLPTTTLASVIEATIGSAVVNDATAVFFNPAALTQLKKPQAIGLNTELFFNTRFTGQVTASNITQTGTSRFNTAYSLTSGYFATPTNDKIFLGIAVMSNGANRDIDGGSVLRYVESSNNVQDVDVIPAIGIKLTDYLSFGANLDVTSANFLFKAKSGFSQLNIPDAESRNEASDTACGAGIGLLLKPTSSTIIGFNYRTSMSFNFRGTSELQSNPGITSDHYSFDFWTPAKFVLSANQFITSKLGLIGTVQFIKWDIFNDVHIRGVATLIGGQPVIVPEVTVPYHLHNSWVFTAGSHYHFTPDWVIRVAGSYLQSPGNPNTQVSNGDSILAGVSMGYKFSKKISIDGGYGHVFVQDQNIHINNQNKVSITGINRGSRDVVSVKLTYNI